MAGQGLTGWYPTIPNFLFPELSNFKFHLKVPFETTTKFVSGELQVKVNLIAECGDSLILYQVLVTEYCSDSATLNFFTALIKTTCPYRREGNIQYLAIT